MPLISEIYSNLTQNYTYLRSHTYIHKCWYKSHEKNWAVSVKVVTERRQNYVVENQPAGWIQKLSLLCSSNLLNLAQKNPFWPRPELVITQNVTSNFLTKYFIISRRVVLGGFWVVTRGFSGLFGSQYGILGSQLGGVCFQIPRPGIINIIINGITFTYL